MKWKLFLKEKLKTICTKQNQNFSNTAYRNCIADLKETHNDFRILTHH